MDREPSYPVDAPVGVPADKADAEAATSQDGTEAKSGESSRTRKLVTGAAIGIGSAALVAALLYANRSRKGSGTNEPK
ncbi:MAG TPA: hypothetical protein VGX37_05635 [Allosphingosinicella sp.]|jgi:hypothetical protein|nr:hypothetical protein [Allosphingosinicella sp.]